MVKQTSQLYRAASLPRTEGTQGRFWHCLNLEVQQRFLMELRFRSFREWKGQLLLVPLIKHSEAGLGSAVVLKRQC